MAKTDEKGTRSGSKRLKYADVKELYEQIRDVPMGAMLPDMTALTVGNRFAIAVRFLPRENRQSALEKSLKQIDRYEGADLADQSTPKIPMEVMHRISSYSKLPVAWLLTGRPRERTEATIKDGEDQLPPLEPNGDVPLQKLAFKASAGHGFITMDDSAQYVRFPRAILDHINVKPQNARLMESTGLSMWPTIDDGDLMVVDISETTIADGRIYVFSIGEEMFVKRLLRGAASLIMKSDNKQLFPNDEEVPEVADLKIFGRVRWTGKSL